MASSAQDSSSVRAFLDDETGQIVVSILLGLGLAALFRKACRDNSCIVIKGPSEEETQKYYYKVDDECYKYNRVQADCTTEKQL